jgi:hypothetical protein
LSSRGRGSAIYSGVGAPIRRRTCFWLVLLLALLVLPDLADAGGRIDLRTGTDLLIRGGGGPVAPAGDVNGDGAEDLIVATGTSAYVLFGPFASGEVNLGALGSGGFRIDVGDNPFDPVRSLAGIGDMNGDGLDDVILGTPGLYYGAAPGVGRAYVIFGKTSSAPVLGNSLGAQGFRILGGTDRGVALSVSGTGDVNGDGTPDVILGSESGNRASVVFGKPTAGDISIVTPGNWGFRIENSFDRDYLGLAVLGVGDMNRDGLGDVAVGAPRACLSFCDNEGAVYVIWGKATTTLVDVHNLGEQGFRIYGPAERTYGKSVGQSIASAGDMNGDGLQDLLVAAGYGGSSAFVVWGKSTTTPIFLDDPGFGGFETIGPGGCCDLSLAGGGDVNGDQRPDVVVGAMACCQAEYKPDPAAWAILGTPSGPTVRLDQGVPGVVAYSGAPFGAFYLGMMDMNADGLSDVLIPVPGGVGVSFSRVVPTDLALSPLEETNVVGHQHCVTAKARNVFLLPATGFLIRFEVSGRNTTSGSARTDEQGEARFCFAGTRAGPDTISAYADSNEDGVRQWHPDAPHQWDEPAAIAQKLWLAGSPARLTLSPASATNQVDATHCVTGTVVDEFGNPTDGIVRFTVVGGRAGNSASGSQSSSEGVATFCYTGPALGPSTDAITAYVDKDRDGVRDTDEPTASASKDWVPADSSTGCRVSGQGTATTSGGRRVRFTIQASALPSGVQGVVLHHEEGAPSPKIKSVALAALVCAQDRSVGSLFGEGTVDGNGPFLLRVDVREGDTTGEASYRLRLSSGFDSGRLNVQSGGISIELR